MVTFQRHQGGPRLVFFLFLALVVGLSWDVATSDLARELMFPTHQKPKRRKRVTVQKVSSVPVGSLSLPQTEADNGSLTVVDGHAGRLGLGDAVAGDPHTV